MSKPLRSVGHLVPPAVADRAVEHAVEGRLHATGAARLHRTAGRVQPHVAAVVHRAGDADVVVGDEHETVANVGAAGEPIDLADERLAGLVGRMRLAGEDELHRSVVVEQQRLETFDLTQEQRRALVGGEATGESDREHVRVEQILAETVTDHVDQFAAAAAAHVPDLVVAQVLHPRPLGLAGQVPLVADHLVRAARRHGRSPTTGRGRRS